MVARPQLTHGSILAVNPPALFSGDVGLIFSFNMRIVPCNLTVSRFCPSNRATHTKCSWGVGISPGLFSHPGWGGSTESHQHFPSLWRTQEMMYP